MKINGEYRYYARPVPGLTGSRTGSNPGTIRHARAAGRLAGIGIITTLKKA